MDEWRSLSDVVREAQNKRNYETLLAAASAMEQWRGTLIAAVKIIKDWHNIRLGLCHQQEAWSIYWRNAPEMAPIREALPGVDLDFPGE
jgi:hypothetical protein